MSLQIVTVKEIEKERNRRYDTSDRRVLSRDLLGGIFPKKNFGNSLPRISGLSLILCGSENE